MIDEVKIYSREKMECFSATGGYNFPYKSKNWSLISIYCSPDDKFLNEMNTTVMKRLGMRESLSLCFWDVRGDIETFKSINPDAFIFTEEQAQLVVGFLINADQDDYSTLVIHCDAGISRSGAVGAFAVEFLSLDYNEFKVANPDANPNPHVLHMLRKVSGIEK